MELSELYEKVSQMPHLQAKLTELTKQRLEYDKQVLSLRAVYRNENADAEKLESGSLANYFYKVIGKLDEKLDKERQEAYAAKVKLDAAQRELDGIELDISEINYQLSEAEIAQAHFQTALKQRRQELLDSGSQVSEQILEYEGQAAELDARIKEIQEAIQAGKYARSQAGRVMSALESADDWNTFDMIGGGGMITHAVKHSHLNEAEYLVSQLQSSLRKFKTELTDIHINSDLNISVDGFLKFADYFFDGLFVDWTMGEQIQESMYKVKKTKRDIESMLYHLEKMEQEAKSSAANLRMNLEQLLVNG